MKINISETETESLCDVCGIYSEGRAVLSFWSGLDLCEKCLEHDVRLHEKVAELLGADPETLEVEFQHGDLGGWVKASWERDGMEWTVEIERAKMEELA